MGKQIKRRNKKRILLNTLTIFGILLLLLIFFYGRSVVKAQNGKQYSREELQGRSYMSQEETVLNFNTDGSVTLKDGTFRRKFSVWERRSRKIPRLILRLNSG